MAILANFDFETKSLSPFMIEHGICNYCGIGEPIRSDLGSSISPTFTGRVNIYADSGRVSCSISIVPLDSSNFCVSVEKIDATGKRGKTIRR